MSSFDSIIAAISTAPGSGAIGIVRMSGANVLQVIETVFEHSRPIHDRYACFGKIIDPENADLIDTVIVLYFRAPHSFTGQDIIEIHSHGSPYILEKILSLLTTYGAVLAAPGEFTKRAFLNGKMDLLQAESVADIIQAQTEKSLRQSNAQLEGVLSDKLLTLKDRLREQAALLEIELDFSEEDIEFASRHDLLHMVEQIILEAKKLVNTFRYGQLIHEGTSIVIAGEPNVGKSSILNRLLLTDRAIVSEIPGTTRDTLEELLDIQGYLFRITDTAGLRDTFDQIEKEGVRRSKKNIEMADVILYVLDAGKAKDDFSIPVTLQEYQHLIVLFNKTDLFPDRDISFINDYPVLKISAKTGQGFSSIENELIQFVKNKNEQDTVITKIRHKNALLKSIEYLEHALSSLNQSLSEEYVAMDLKGALDALGELTGETTSDDILNDIFSKFCIGK